MPLGQPGGFLLSLVTESFAVRALLGSLAAAGLSAALVGSGAVRSSRARRLLLLAPVLTAAAAAVASIGEAYLPQLSVTTSAGSVAAAIFEAFSERGALSAEAGLNLLILTYGLVVGILLSRRALGVVAVRRALRPSVPADGDSPIARQLDSLSAAMGVRRPELRLLERCPGGAFTVGTRSPVVVVDPALVHELDEQELEGLLAHELAHVARRDTLLGTVVGVFRDLAFFLPPLHLAVGWLQREQEESADELASRHTGRPVALASSILKVWDRNRDQRHLHAVCAMVPGRVALPSGVIVGRPERAAMRVITARVERLIACLPAPSRLRRWSEMALASAVLAAGTTAALTVPSWLAKDLDYQSLTFVYLSAPPATPVESPAMATFRALAPAPTTVAEDEGPGFRLAAAPVAGCPCVESQAQLRSGDRGQLRTRSRLAWTNGRPAWEMIEPEPAVTAQTARPLWRIGQSGSQVGFFLVGAPRS